MGDRIKMPPAKGYGQDEMLLARLDRLESLFRAGRTRPAPAPRPATNGLAADLERRLAALERLARPDGEDEPAAAEEAPLQYCAVPPTPPRVFAPDVSPNRARLILDIGKKWVNGTKLHYWFFDGGAAAGGEDQRQIVRQAFDVWKNVGIGIRFEEVRDIASAEVRIGFVQGDGAWSYVGRDVIDVAGHTERTMNFGWDLRTDPRGVDVPVHEIGHTLGFPHEHQNPFAGIVWDEEAVYRYFGGPPNNWSRDQTEFNVLRKLTASDVDGSDWDPDSVMEYAFPSGLIREPERYRGGIRPAGGLSPTDVAEAKKFYPPVDDATNPELKPYRSQALALAPAQQANFAIAPTATRTYRMATFGGSDTVMVLFEDQAGDLKYVAGDDDSGTSRNAQITARLVAGRKYVLRLRMYSSFDSGEIAVLLW